jgi:hypothetical protein
VRLEFGGVMLDSYELRCVGTQIGTRSLSERRREFGTARSLRAGYIVDH